MQVICLLSSMLKLTVVLRNIFVETMMLKDFNVTFDQFNASLLNKSVCKKF